MAPICHHFTENGISYGIYLLFTKIKTPRKLSVCKGFGGERGIRTLGTLITFTRFQPESSNHAARGCCHRGQAVEKDLMTGPPECLYNLPRLRPGFIFVYNRTLMSLLQTASMKSWVCMNQY